MRRRSFLKSLLFVPLVPAVVAPALEAFAKKPVEPFLSVHCTGWTISDYGFEETWTRSRISEHWVSSHGLVLRESDIVNNRLPDWVRIHPEKFKNWKWTGTSLS